MIAIAFIPFATDGANRGRGFVLADEAIRFDADLRPQFSAHQLRTSAEARRVPVS